MKNLLLTPVLALGLAPVLWAQSPTDSVPADMRALIPADAMALVRMDSLQSLETAAKRLASAIEPSVVDDISLDALFSEFPPEFDPAWIDLTRPVGFAVGKVNPMTGEEPVFCLFIPSNAPEQLATALAGELPSSRIFGGYLGLSTSEVGYPDADPTAQIAGRVGAGAISGVIDLRPVLDETEPMIKMFASMGRGSMLSEIQADQSMPAPIRAMAMDLGNGAFDFLDDFIESVTEVHFSLDLNGTLVALDGSVHFSEGSPVAELKNMDGPRFFELRRFMDASAPSTQAAGFDLSFLAKTLRPYIDEVLNAIPVEEHGDSGPFESQQQAFEAVRTAIDRGVDLVGHFGDGMVSNAHINAGGMSMGGWIHGVQGDQLAGALMALFEVELASMAGLDLTMIESTESTQRMELTFTPETVARNFGLSEWDLKDLQEMKQAFFPQPMGFSTTTVGDQTLFIVNGSRDTITQALASAKQTVKQDSMMLDMVQVKLGDSYPFSASLIQMGPYLAGLGAYVGSIEPDQAPNQEDLDAIAAIDLPIANYVGFDGLSFKMGMSADVKNVSQFIELLEVLDGPAVYEAPPLEAVPAD